MADLKPQPDPIDNAPDLRGIAEPLARIYHPAIRIPDSVDSAMRSRIHQHFANTHQPAHRNWRIAPWTSVAFVGCVGGGLAAVITIGIWLSTPGPSGTDQQPLARHVPGDVDADGSINILDAFALARRIEDKAFIESDLDLNGDGAIDSRDVDAIAMQAVSLQPRQGAAS